MKIFEKWNSIVRWTLFIPMLFLTSFLINVITHLSITSYLTPPEPGNTSYIIQTILHDGISLGVGIYTSCMCAPKYKVAIASSYTSIILLALGWGIINGTLDTSYDFFSSAVTVVGCLLALWTVFEVRGERGKNARL